MKVVYGVAEPSSSSDSPKIEGPHATQARRSLIEWRDTFAKQGRKPADELEVEQESYVQDEMF